MEVNTRFCQNKGRCCPQQHMTYFRPAAPTFFSAPISYHPTMTTKLAMFTTLSLLLSHVYGDIIVTHRRPSTTSRIVAAVVVGKSSLEFHTFHCHLIQTIAVLGVLAIICFAYAYSRRRRRLQQYYAQNGGGPAYGQQQSFGPPHQYSQGYQMPQQHQQFAPVRCPSFLPWA